MTVTIHRYYFLRHREPLVSADLLVPVVPRVLMVTLGALESPVFLVPE